MDEPFSHLMVGVGEPSARHAIWIVVPFGALISWGITTNSMGLGLALTVKLASASIVPNLF